MSGKKLFLVIGNGFSIDYLNHINASNEIDLVNLFKHGAEVPWPATGIPGFLSFKHCPHLWNLGARPNMEAKDAMQLIEDIITCVNVYALKGKGSSIGHTYRHNDIYIYAYNELLQYLKHLFIFYDAKIPKISEESETWPWLKFIKHAYQDEHYKEIVIVTYNYDIWLERILTEFSIPYNIHPFNEDNLKNKITILKPHGSISFTHSKKLDKDSYAIKLDNDELLNGKIDDFTVKYESLDENYLISALIPPAGESSRLNLSWASKIREGAKQQAKDLGEDDEMIICGLSYWHVDRSELDDLLVSCNPLMNVTMVNPSPHRTITAVLTSVFSNFVTYSGSETLNRKIQCQTS